MSDGRVAYDGPLHASMLGASDGVPEAAAGLARSGHGLAGHDHHVHDPDDSAAPTPSWLAPTVGERGR